MSEHALLPILSRIADALERLSPKTDKFFSLNDANCWIWHGEDQMLEPVNDLKPIPLSLLQGIEHVRDILHMNTEQFANGLPANNALLWGARGMGKSSLVKAIFASISINIPQLCLIEVQRDELDTLPALLHILKISERRYILFCDDMSFDAEDSSYKSLKTVLDGSIAGRPDNVIFYATSNRRHLMPRDMMENERRTAIHPGEGVEEKVSLSDRFGLWLGFHSCNQDDYLNMIDAYASYFELTSNQQLHRDALEWATTRGSRSGRVAWQFITDHAGKQGKNLKI
jgi:predicted AAA+ superfamily ATPase